MADVRQLAIGLDIDRVIVDHAVPMLPFSPRPVADRSPARTRDAAGRG